MREAREVVEIRNSSMVCLLLSYHLKYTRFSFIRKWFVRQYYVTCVSTWTKAVPCVAGSGHVSMLYLNITFILNTAELYTMPTNN